MPAACVAKRLLETRGIEACTAVADLEQSDKNIASIAGLRGTALGAKRIAYSRSKAGGINMARPLASEWGVHNINDWRSIRKTDSTVIDMTGTIMVLLARAPEDPDEHDNTVRVCLAPILQLSPHIPS